MDDYNLPPLSPDDFHALAALGRDVYQESKRVESYISDNPVHGESPNSGSSIIRRQLEEAERIAKENARRMALANIQQPQPQPVINPAIVGGPEDEIPEELFDPSVPVPTNDSMPQNPQTLLQGMNSSINNTSQIPLHMQTYTGTPPEVLAPSTSTPVERQSPTPAIDNHQMELMFDKNKQDITNEILKEISGKLTKILKILEPNQKQEGTPPSKKYVRKNQV